MDYTGLTLALTRVGFREGPSLAATGQSLFRSVLDARRPSQRLLLLARPTSIRSAPKGCDFFKKIATERECRSPAPRLASDLPFRQTASRVFFAKNWRHFYLTGGAMGSVWVFLQKPRNRRLLSWFGGGAVVIVGGIWAAVSHVVKAASDGPTAIEGVAVGGSVSNSTINNTVNKQDPAVLAAMTKIFADQMAVTTEARAKAEAKAAEVAQKLGFTSTAVAEFFKILGEQNVPEEKIPVRLIEIATHFAQTRDELATLEPDDPHAAKLARSARAALDAGRLTEADGLLDQAKEAELAAFRQAHELKEKAQEAEDRHARNAAKLLAGRGNIALTLLRYPDAAKQFKQAATLVPPSHPDETASYLHNEADALYRQGDERGDNAALKQSIETWHLVLERRTRDR